MFALGLSSQLTLTSPFDIQMYKKNQTEINLFHKAFKLVNFEKVTQISYTKSVIKARLRLKIFTAFRTPWWIEGGGIMSIYISHSTQIILDFYAYRCCGVSILDDMEIQDQTKDPACLSLLH